MVWRKQRDGVFLLEAAVILLLLMAAAGSIAHFAAATARARQEQWVRFQQETQLDNVVERLQHVAPAQWEAAVNDLMEDERYGRPRIDTETISVEGVPGRHVVITAGPADSPGQTEFWRFHVAETDAAEAGEDDASN